MATIHPKPKLIDIRDDGDGGLQLTVTTHRSELEVLDVSPERAAKWAARLSEFVARKLTEDRKRRDAAELQRLGMKP